MAEQETARQLISEATKKLSEAVPRSSEHTTCAKVAQAIV